MMHVLTLFCFNFEFSLRAISKKVFLAFTFDQINLQSFFFFNLGFPLGAISKQMFHAFNFGQINLQTFFKLRVRFGSNIEKGVTDVFLILVGWVFGGCCSAGD